MVPKISLAPYATFQARGNLGFSKGKLPIAQELSRLVYPGYLDRGFALLFPFLRPVVPQPDTWVDRLATCYEHRYFSNFGALATSLASRMSKAYLQDGYAGALCSSNTAGLVAVIQALDLYGKKIVLPDFTFAATVQAAFAAGAKPVICDIRADTWELCPDSLKAALAEHPDIAAVVHVRPFGLHRDLSPIRDICDDRGLPLIVDAAAALGAPENSMRFGSDSGEIEVFSLHATKTFAIGEGGLIAAPEEMLPKIKSAMNFGFNSDRTYGEGQNAKLDEFRAAIGHAAMDSMQEVTEGRIRHAEFYYDLFKSFPFLTLTESPGSTPWSTFPVVFPEPVTSNVLGAFSDQGIEIKRYYWPGVIKGYTGPREILSVETPNSFDLQDRCACFPVYSDFEQINVSLLKERIHMALGQLFS
ncbi:aminotransferase class I/II-fold pyridoxal phosphate-dependent enzyme [Roseovarius sp. MMSF_3281]|uniref:aminotransferase class I/II-fold pyridoxal phosphate-dependent enzyme n=1 Tax=Roseovarius sp. MMSF_3281 TaxID=3046694 RepID=UPI00273D58F5|nr:aminotransferase class I/II-fold pyridoxal phosphate-dependent enzyme [Roseovarius sp. MMSF_3281]